MGLDQQERDYYTQIHQEAQTRIKHMLSAVGELEEQCGHLEEHRLGLPANRGHVVELPDG